MSEEEKRETFRESKILEVLNHPNIIRFKEVYKTKKGQLCIVMDYADGKKLLLFTQYKGAIWPKWSRNRRRKGVSSQRT